MTWVFTGSAGTPTHAPRCRLKIKSQPMQEAQNQGTRAICDDSFDILLIEDEDPHVELIQRAFSGVISISSE